MINKDELLFVVDENNQPLAPKPRKIVHGKRMWHRTSGVWIINSKKEILCQRRSLKKDQNPGFWEAFFGGHLAPGEDYLDNACSEVSEELGIKVYKKDFKFYNVFKSNKPKHAEFQGVFALFSNATKFKLEEDEIDEVKWLGIDRLKRILLYETKSKWVRKFWDREVLNWLKKSYE